MNSVKQVSRIAILFFILLCSILGKSQTRLIMNGGFIRISGNAKLVIDNPLANAITRIDGRIVTEGENNEIKWNIGTTTGTYLVPFGNSTDYLPFQFTKTAGTGNGSFLFATYHTGWKNSDFLPAGVSHMSFSSSDASELVADRFWKINASGYSTKPDLSNLVFTYTDTEHNAAGNMIIESALKANRWNESLAVWNDNTGFGSADITANTVTVNAVAAADLFKWWAIAQRSTPVPVHMISFAATTENRDVRLNWISSSEISNRFFVVQRSRDGNLFQDIGMVPALTSGNSINQYAFLDTSAFQGRSFYRLKQVDNGGSFSLSMIRTVMIAADRIRFSIYPNPVTNHSFIFEINEALKENGRLNVLDATGNLVYAQELKSGNQKFNISLPAWLQKGVYLLQVKVGGWLEQEKILLG